MLHTGLVLGDNWSADEWPESVDVMHEGVGDRLKYVPERTCRNLGGEDGTNYELYDFACSYCGYCADITEPNYCPNCRAKVIDE